MSEAIYGSESGVRARIWVVPGGSSDQIVGMHGDRVKIKTAAPAEGGRADESVRRRWKSYSEAPCASSAEGLPEPRYF